MDEKILTRVRGLLAKAESTEFPEEAEALNAKARELIARYGVDQALLAAAGKIRDEIIQREIVIEPPYVIDKDGLLASVCKPLRCECIHTKRRDGSRIVTVVGFTSDVERIELLYTSLLVQAAGQLTKLRSPNGASTTSYRKTWFAGFSGAVMRRLEKAEQRAATDSTTNIAAEASAGVGISTALVLVERKQQVSAAFHEAFPDVRNARSRKLRGDGYRDGRDAGQRADLGNGRVGGRKAAIGRG